MSDLEDRGDDAPSASSSDGSCLVYFCNNSPPTPPEKHTLFTNEFRWRPLINALNEPASWVPLHPFCKEYWSKFAGLSFRIGVPARGSNHPAHSLISFIGSFVGMLLVALIFSDLAADALLMASLGATSVLVYAAPTSPMAQPRNVIGGSVIGAVVGVAMNYAFRDTSVEWIGSALAVSLTILIMDATNTPHPPAGATALLPLIGSQEIRDLGFLYIAYPVLASEAVLLLVALVVNNFARFRSYPLWWI